MKSLPIFFVRLATLSGVSVLLFTLNSAAATHPLNSPQGLAVASNGNLYVANNGGNNILVYGPAHVQMSAKTITKNISGPPPRKPVENQSSKASRTVRSLLNCWQNSMPRKSEDVT